MSVDHALPIFDDQGNFVRLLGIPLHCNSIGDPKYTNQSDPIIFFLPKANGYDKKVTWEMLDALIRLLLLRVTE